MAQILILAAAALDVVDAFGYFKDRIPNGHNVTVDGESWRAVGHTAPFWKPGCFGEFERSSFGRDFEASGFQWTEWLCRQDSDNDGWSNGDELGDPHCLFSTPEWEKWMEKHPNAEIRHPGLNEFEHKCISGVRKCSARDVADQVRTLSVGEEVSTSYKTTKAARSFHTERGVIIDGPSNEMEPHEVRVNVTTHQGAIQQKLPRTWMIPVVDSPNTSFSYVPQYAPEDPFPEGPSVFLNASFYSQWYSHNLVVASCSKHGRHQMNWLPIGELIWVFVNLIIPTWALINWLDLQAKGQWRKVNVWAIWIIVFLITQVGISTGYHRHFTHKTFKAKPLVSATLAMIGQLALQGDAIYWSALHRTHHRRCDQQGDPHSPLQGGFFHSHGGFVWNDGAYDFSYRVVAFDLIIDKSISWVKDQGIISIVGLPLLSHLLFGRHNTLWYLHVPQFVGWQVTQIVNSVCHLWGYSPYANDAMSAACVSKNSPWMWALVYGEIWHNNHHAIPSRANLGVRSWELDPAHALICLLEFTGFAWDVKRDTRIQDEVPSVMEAFKVLGSCVSVFILLKAIDQKINGTCSTKPMPPPTRFQGGLVGFLSREAYRMMTMKHKIPNDHSITFQQESSGFSHGYLNAFQKEGGWCAAFQRNISWMGRGRCVRSLLRTWRSKKVEARTV